MSSLPLRSNLVKNYLENPIERTLVSYPKSENIYLTNDRLLEQLRLPLSDQNDRL